MSSATYISGSLQTILAFSLFIYNGYRKENFDHHVHFNALYIHAFLNFTLVYCLRNYMLFLSLIFGLAFSAWSLIYLDLFIILSPILVCLSLQGLHAHCPCTLSWSQG